MPVLENMPPMTYRYLGRTGLQVSCISLGSWLTYGGDMNNDDAFACIETAYLCGINLFDCAEAYADGEGEVIMGKAIGKFGWNRNDLVISTKLYFGQAFGNSPVNNRGLSRKHVIEGIAGSLRRLNLDYVDLVYAHRPDRNTSVEEIVRAFNHIIDTGKAFYWGTSEWDASEIALAWRIADRLGLIGPAMEQPRYNMNDRDRVEDEYLHLYREVGTGLTVYSPLDRGLLSGKYKAGLPADSRLGRMAQKDAKGFSDQLPKRELDAIIAKVNSLEEIACRLGVSQSALALAWVLKNEHVSSAITGATRPEQIIENCKAVAVVELLTRDIMDEIGAILDGSKSTKVDS